jgi:hypothetical protein
MVIRTRIPRILNGYCVACRFIKLNFVVALIYVVGRNLNFRLCGSLMLL